MDYSQDVLESISYPTGGVISKVIVKSERLNVTLFCMAAGTDISEHTSTREATVQVLEGDGIFTLAGDPIEMRPGVLIHMKASQPHSIVAKGNTSFLLSLFG